MCEGRGGGGGGGGGLGGESERERERHHNIIIFMKRRHNIMTGVSESLFLTKNDPKRIKPLHHYSHRVMTHP